METEPTPSKADPAPQSRSAMIIERAPLPIVEVQGSAHLVSHVNSATLLAEAMLTFLNASQIRQTPSL